MKIELAKTAGFCFGVKRAVDTVYRQIRENQEKPIYTYGPIIHNDEVIKDLKAQGVTVLLSLEELEKLEKGTVVIRSHGVSRMVYGLLQEKGLHIVDATCPFVKKIHRIVEKESGKGAHIVIIGNENHPEVEGIKGWAGKDVTVIQTAEEAKSFHLPGDQKQKSNQKVCIVSQTTFNYKKFQELVEIISKKGYDRIVLDTICNATRERQEEAREIAARVGAMIVIGDKKSSNTQKLYEICSDACEDTYYIQTLGDLNVNQLRSVETVGITAGASTPSKIIEEVQKNVRINI